MNREFSHNAVTCLTSHFADSQWFLCSVHH